MSSVRGVFASISTWEWLALLLLLPVALFPVGPQAFLLLLIPIFWLLYFINGEGLFPSTPFNLGLALMVAMILISLTVTFDFTLSLTKITGILYGIALLMSTTRLVRTQSSRIWWAVTVVLAAGAAMALLGLIGVTWLEPFNALNGVKASLPAVLQSIPGAVGGVINENELAGSLVWVAPLFIACLIGLPRTVHKYGIPLAVSLAAGAFLLSGVIIATQSRGGVLALLIGTALVVTLFAPRQWRLVVLVVACVSALVWYFSYGSALDAATPNLESLELESRIEIWSRAIAAITDFPLTGVSVNGFRQIIQVLYPTFAVDPSLDLGHAHNQLLQAGLDLGLPGLVGYLSIWFLAAGMLVRNLRRLIHLQAEHHPYYVLTVGLSGSLIAGWAFGLLDTISLGARPGFIWWLLIALAGGVHYLVMYQSETAGRRLRRSTPQTQSSPAAVPQPAAVPTGSATDAYPESRPRSRPRMRYRPPGDS